MWNVPAVLNGPTSVWPPLMLTPEMVGAPGSLFVTWLPLLSHMPLLIMCSTCTSSISVSFEPLVILTQGVTKLLADICTDPVAHPPDPPPLEEVGVLPPLFASGVPGLAQAANRTLPSARMTSTMPIIRRRLLFMTVLPLTQSVLELFPAWYTRSSKPGASKIQSLLLRRYYSDQQFNIIVPHTIRAGASTGNTVPALYSVG